MHLLYIKRTLADERVRYIKLGGEWGGVRASLLVCVVCVHTGVVDITLISISTPVYVLECWGESGVRDYYDILIIFDCFAF